MSSQPPARVAVEPASAPAWMSEAVEAGGGQVVPLAEAEALVWGDHDDPAGLAEALGAARAVRWVQLPWAGIEEFVHLVDDGRLWTCGKGVYAEPVAEMALALGLAGLRGLGFYGRQRSWSGEKHGVNLIGSRVTVVGGGGIAESLLRLLRPFGAHVTVVRNTPEAMDGADEVFGSEHLDRALPGADLVVLALSLTPETTGLMGADQFELMEDHAWLVNVARGGHVVTDELVDALRDGVIGGAALDVTDPEPLPDDHPLWGLPNCIITPHVGNTPAMARPLLSARITENVRRWCEGEPLVGPVDPAKGY